MSNKETDVKTGARTKNQNQSDSTSLPQELSRPVSPPEFKAEFKYTGASLGEMTSEDHLSARLEGFVLASKNLEKTLGQEKMRNQALSLELTSEKNQLHQALNEFHNAEQGLYEAEQRAQTLRRQILELSQKNVTVTEELKTYKDRWSQVLSREESVRQVVPRLEAEQLKSLELDEELKKLKVKYSKFETHSIKEMNGAADRIIELEDKSEELQDQLSQLQESYRKLDKESQYKLTEAQNEISKRDQEIKDLQALSFKLRQKLETVEDGLKVQMTKFEDDRRLALEKESAWEREKFRDSLNAQVKSEMDKEIQRITSEKTAELLKLKDQNESLKKRANSLEKTLKAEQEDFETNLELEVKKRLLSVRS